jgi:hypothetical protein
MENVVDRLRFLSATRCDISRELEFIASHFDDFLPRPDALNAGPFTMIYEIIRHVSLRIDSEDSLYDFVSKCTETNREMFRLLEFVRWEYCSTEVMNDFLNLLSEHLCEIDASMWASLRSRLVLPNIKKETGKQFPPSMKKRKIQVEDGWGMNRRTVAVEIDAPDGIIAHRTRECGGNVHDRHVVDVTCGSFEKETWGANPQSGAYDNRPDRAAKSAADLEADSDFFSPYRDDEEEDIPRTRNNWVCYGFKERRIVPTHYTIRTNIFGPGNFHLRSWLVETLADGESWREVAHEEDNEQLNGSKFTGTFEVADVEE